MGWIGLAVIGGLYGCGKKARSHEAAQRMRQLVENIAAAARQADPDFLIIPQNGEELAFEDLDPEADWAQPYFNVLDAVGVEEVFYSGTYRPRPDRLAMLRRIREHKPVFDAEYVGRDDSVEAARRRCAAEGFRCFVRTPGNYHYAVIPDTVPFENARDILRPADAQNYLYLISYDSFASRSDLLRRLQATNFDLLIIEPFWGHSVLTPAEVASLQRKANGGRRLVIAYFNIGAAEKWRYYWQPDWRVGEPKWLKKPYEGYPDEVWVEFWHEEWQRIIWKGEDSYLQKLIEAGFDGAYLDNVEAYYFLYYE